MKKIALSLVLATGLGLAANSLPETPKPENKEPPKPSKRRTHPTSPRGRRHD